MLRTKYLALAAGLTMLTGIGLAGTAQASSTGCAFSNGCATLHGTDALGYAVAMDAKRQVKTGIVIGYPDNASDNATSFDGVLHYGKGKRVTTYADTGLQFSPTITSLTCGLGTAKPVITGDVLSVTAGKSLTVKSTTGTVTPVAGTSGASITLGGTGTLVVDDTYNGSACVEAFTYSVSSGSPVWTSSDAAKLAFPVSSGNSEFTFTDSSTGGSFSFTGLPAGISESGGTLTADTSTAVPGTYTDASVSYTDANGAVFTATFTLEVSGIKSVSPGAGVPYYTFVYAPHGDWTSECVTDINGSGALKLDACTEGRDTGQDFTAGSSGGLLGSTPVHVSNLLAAAVGASSCLVDPSVSNPAAGQSDAADETAPGGRQLYVDGSCAAGSNLWSWGT